MKRNRKNERYPPIIILYSIDTEALVLIANYALQWEQRLGVRLRCLRTAHYKYAASDNGMPLLFLASFVNTSLKHRNPSHYIMATCGSESMSCFIQGRICRVPHEK